MLPVNSQMQGMNQPKGPSNPRYKTSLCKHFGTPQGCSYGDKCQFAHGNQELRLNNNQMPYMMAPGTPGVAGSKTPNSMLNYKIVKCKNWEKDKTCKYGAHCTFAHGDNDLRTKSDNLYMGTSIPVMIPYQYDMNPMGMMMPPNMDINQMQQMMAGNMGQNPIMMGMMMPQNGNFQSNNENAQGNEDQKNEENNQD